MSIVISICLIIALEVVKANSWFIIPQVASILAYVLLGYIVVNGIVSTVVARNEIQKAQRRF